MRSTRRAPPTSSSSPAPPHDLPTKQRRPSPSSTSTSRSHRATKRPPVAPAASRPPRQPSKAASLPAGERKETLSHAVVPDASNSAPEVEVWTFDGDEDEEGAGVREIPLSTFFSSAHASASSSFVSLAPFSLPSLPSFDSLPLLLDTLTGERQPQALAESLSSLAAFPPTALLSSMHLPALLSALSALVLHPSLGDRCVLTLAGLFDEAAESREAADVFIAVVDGLRRLWTEQGRLWTAIGGIRWNDNGKTVKGETAQSTSLSGPHLHARLLQVVRFISAMQLRLPGYWEQCSLSQQQDVAEAVMTLYALMAPSTAALPTSSSATPLEPSSLSPVHFFALVDPKCRWLHVWLYPISMRRRILTILSSPSYSSLLAALSSHTPPASVASAPPPLPHLSSPREAVTAEEATSLLRFHSYGVASALRLHASGRRLLWCETDQDTLGLASVPRVSAAGFTPQLFLDRFVHSNRPVIVTDALTHWSKGHPWSLSHLQSAIGSLLMQNVFRSRDGRFKFFAQSKADSEEVLGLQREERMTFEDFVRKASRMENGDRYYLYGEPLPTSLQPILTPPAMLGLCPSLTSSLLWVSVTGSLSPLHFDLSDGVLAQVEGVKRFLLCPPSLYQQLAPHPVSHPHDRQSTLQLPTSPSLALLPPTASPFLCTLQPSELLYLPYGWWHQVESRGVSISVTYRWNEWEDELKRVQVVEATMRQRGLPPAAIAAIVAEALGALPSYVAVWAMRRSPLSAEFERLSKI